MTIIKFMDAHERMVAEAAINVGCCYSYEEIYDKVSQSTAASIDEVKHILEHLAAEGTLRRRCGPAHHVSKSETSEYELVRGWFEKGDLWPK